MSENIAERRKNLIEIQTEKSKVSADQLQRERDATAEKVKAGQADPLLLVIKDKQLERHFSDHDSTGAKQGRLLGKDLADSLEQSGLDTDTETGHLMYTSADSRTYLGMVSLVELERLNTEGGHLAGNRALASTVGVIENTIRDVIMNDPLAEGFNQPLENLYDIYHTRGGDFGYVLKFPKVMEGVHDELARKVLGAVQKIRINNLGEAVSADQFRRAEDLYIGSPLAATHIRRDSAIEMFNDYQDSLRAKGRDPVIEDSVRRTVLNLWRKTAEVALEKEWRSTRAQRYLELAQAGDPGAKQYFENYVKKFFAGTEMEAIDDFHVEETTGVDLQSAVEERVGQIQSTIEQSLLSELSQERQGVDPNEQVMLDIVAGQELPDTEEGLSDDDREYIDEMNAEHKIDVTKLRDRPVQTKGKMYMEYYGTVIVNLGDIFYRLGKERTIDEADEMILRRLVPLADIPQTVDVFGEEVAVDTSIDEIFDRIKQGPAEDSDIAKLRLIAGAAGENFDLALSKHDELTGLPNRVEYQLSMREDLQHIQELEANGELQEGVSLQLIFIDLGFLKYMNMGGREIGNLSLQRTAEIMEQAMTDLGIDGKAFRYAGDEFTITFVGTEEEKQQLIDRIQELKEAEEIPRTDKSSPLYRPEKLMINYGTADSRIAAETFQSLVDKGVISQSDADERGDAYYDYLISLQTRIADLSIESQKAFSRFIHLIDRVGKEFPEDNSEAVSLKQRQTETLIKFSQKSIFGKNLADLHELAFNSEYDIGTIDGLKNLQAMIVDESREEQELIDDNRKLEDAVVLTYVHENAANTVISSLQNQLDMKRVYHERRQQEMEMIQQELAQQDEDQYTIGLLQEELRQHRMRETEIVGNTEEIDRVEDNKRQIAENREKLRIVEQSDNVE